MAASSSSSSSSSSFAPTKWNYDVFLSFRGEDTRKNFVDHLYTALKQKGIRVFRDDEELERGREISPELVKAIEESRFSIIIFSENYAFSSWCLDELVKIIDCTRETGQIALPIFYNVDPSNVRKQKGSFEEAFAKHEKEYSKENTEKMQRWRIALSQAANLSGWDSRNRHESEFIQDIAEKMFHKLNPALLHIDNNIVGIDFHLEKLDVLLSSSKESKDVKFVGIYGLGGIGKTTISKAVYNKISTQFEGCSYLANVREISKKNGLVSIQKQLLYDILKVSEMRNSDLESVIKNSLCHKRVLILMDDVDHLDQLERLAGNHHWFGPGSRVIITTRDEHLLVAHEVDEKYKVRELGQDESMELFSWKAFKQNHPVEDYIELSNNVVNYAKGLPLALKVLGSFLCGRSKMAWKSTLDKLKKVPNKEVTDILKISYDGLELTEKDIFLDIACFFKGKDKDFVSKILDSCGFFASIGIQVLNDRSLISFSVNNMLLMHDLVQDMGRDIVCQESPKDPCKRSRLWHYEDIRDVLRNNVDTKAVEAIMIEDLPTPCESEDRRKGVDLCLGAKAFVKMKTLRLLKIRGVHLPQGLNKLPDELRVLDWQRYPLKYLPSSFQPDKLVELNINNSRIEKLWNGIKALENLIVIDLKCSNDLIEIPDLTGAPILEQLLLDYCPKLFELHPSVGLHRRLKYLSLRLCFNLRSFPSRIEMESLETLDLYGCRQLEELPKLLGNMECLSKLYLEGTGIREVPSSIENITGLKLLDLSSCENLMCLPSNICRLEFLEELSVTGCSKLKNLPENLGNLESLVKLDSSNTPIKELPPSIVRLKNLQSLSSHCCRGKMFSTIWEPLFYNSCDFKIHSFSGLSSLTSLNLSYCDLPDEWIPSDFGSLSSLETLDLSGNNFVNLPSSISQLSQLTTLRLIFCESLRALPELPSSIGTIITYDCKSLESLSNPTTVFKSTNVYLGFVNCLKMVSNVSTLGDALHQLIRQALFGNSETCSICLPGNWIPSWFSHESIGSSVSIELPSNWYNKKLRGLAFCVLASPPPQSRPLFRLFRVDSSNVEGGMVISNDAASAMEISYKGRGELEYSHLMLGYISRALLRDDEKRLLKATFIFTGADPEVRVENCGIRLIYDENDEEENV